MAEEHIYNEAYSKTPHMFGVEPEPFLQNYLLLLDSSLPALDVACAQGRNSFFLAKNGFKVVSIDPSKVAIDGIRKIVAKDNLSIASHQMIIEDFVANPESFGVILVFGLFQMLEMQNILEVIKKIKSLLIPGGYVFISAWTIDDSSYEKSKETGKKLSPHSYCLPEGQVRTYLKPNQLAEMFNEMETIYYWEGIGDWHSHSDSEPERHARVEGAFRK